MSGRGQAEGVEITDVTLLTELVMGQKGGTWGLSAKSLGCSRLECFWSWSMEVGAVWNRAVAETLERPI